MANKKTWTLQLQHLLRRQLPDTGDSASQSFGPNLPTSGGKILRSNEDSNPAGPTVTSEAAFRPLIGFRIFARGGYDWSIHDIGKRAPYWSYHPKTFSCSLLRLSSCWLPGLFLAPLPHFLTLTNAFAMSFIRTCMCWRTLSALMDFCCCPNLRHCCWAGEAAPRQRLNCFEPTPSASLKGKADVDASQSPQARLLREQKTGVEAYSVNPQILMRHSKWQTETETPGDHTS